MTSTDGSRAGHVAWRAANQEVDEILSTQDVERIWPHLNANTLRWWRHTKQGPRSFVLGKRRVFYKRSDIEAWLDEQYAAGSPEQRASVG